jgi:hypothetical protein
VSFHVAQDSQGWSAGGIVRDSWAEVRAWNEIRARRKRRNPVVEFMAGKGVGPA